MIYELIILLVGWLYPAFATYSSLSGTQNSQVLWLKYWIVFGIFTAFNFFAGFLEAMVPFLAAIKLCFLFWLLPSLGGGSQLVHDDFVDPFMTRNRAAIDQGVNTVSDMISALLRELIKMIYHLLVDVVEQCWLLTRNADDIHVTPRLQAAINDVIDELRAAQQACLNDMSMVRAIASEVELVELPQSDVSDDDSASTPPIPIATSVPDETIVDETIASASAAVAMPVSSASLFNLTDDDIQLRILIAEAASAMRMQISKQSANREHLAPINQCVRPQKPKRFKRKKGSNASKSEQSEMDDVDRAYSEYCARKEP